MKRMLFMAVAAATIVLAACNSANQKTDTDMNPFLTAYNTPYDVPPFDRISNADFLPAIQEGINQQQAEVAAIVANEAPADFQNTIEALDASGMLLRQVTTVFENLQSANTNEELQQLAKKAAPLTSKNYDDIMLNQPLFDRVAAVYAQRDALDLTTEQKTLLDKTYKRFSRNGAALDDTQKTQLRKINEELSLLSLQFDENLLAETNGFQLFVTDEADLAGLPEDVKNAAAEAATEADQSGKWLFTVQKPSLIPFLQYAENRDLRQKMFEAYINRGDNNNNYDNKKILTRQASLRVERANLLGYPTHAHYMLEPNMAHTPDQVYALLNEVLVPARNMAQKEAAELQKMIVAEGNTFELQPWDWWYYAEKLKMQKYDLDEEQLRPYFELNNVRNGMFEVAGNLYGIKFQKVDGIPVYHPDVQTYAVTEANGDPVGLLYMDFYPRASKGGGAWMTAYREQYKTESENVRPVISMVMNFSKPTGGKPALLSFDEVTTMFHEFGHALHGLLSDCNYITLSGTSVPRDFVELPSQVMENWAAEPEVMRNYAHHYETGEVIPDTLIAKIQNAGKFNQGFTTMEYLAACYLDLDWHSLTTTEAQDVIAFENASMLKIDMPKQIVVRYRSPYFAHVFAGGYSAGYYSYLWAEILDADAFEAFKETSLFDAETAAAFRHNVLERGGTDDPMTLYQNFRGKAPQKEPMLKRKGLI
jgi:peptidyl-dipeptidase Dcp